MRLVQFPDCVHATVPVIVVEVRDTGCVACQKVPLTGWVTALPSILSDPELFIWNAHIFPVVRVGGVDRYSPPAAVPVAGNAAPNVEAVPPPPEPAVTFTRKAPVVSRDSGDVCAVVYVGEEVVTAPIIRPPVWPEVVDPWLAFVGWFAEVAAPVGSETVPVMFVIFQVPDCVAGNVPPLPVTSHAVVFAVFPGWTVHVPP
jgi:hypothetical protein